MTLARALAISLLLGLLPMFWPGMAISLDLPGSAVETGRRVETASAEPFPTGTYQGENTPRLMAEGDVEQVSYRLAGTALTSYQLITPLKTQLEHSGYRILFACADTVCGGFDFRYLLDLLPEPAMHVNLGDFQYLLARHADGRTAAVLTSHARDTGFVQITTVRPTEDAEVRLMPPESAPAVRSDQMNLPDTTSGDIANRLQTNGRVVLSDLEFGTGAARLGPGPFESLRELAAILTTQPRLKVTLVGHTDNVGSLENNTALSQRRANAVRDRLISAYGVAPNQISAEGIGYLAPLMTNETEAGRAKNRRVEAIIASTQ